MNNTNIFTIQTGNEFIDTMFRTFRFQALYNPVYKAFLQYKDVHPGKITTIKEIPFLPVSFFRTHKVTSFSEDPETIFISSGTSNSIQSKHYIKDISFYKKSFFNCFELFYGSPEEYCILALLPSYKERESSSLVYMVDGFSKMSKSNKSGFYLYNHDELYRKLLKNEQLKKKTILFGVSFALLDFIEKFTLKLHHTIIMETGGMKGRREEITREELHEKLKKGFGVSAIHSEYGMTELLSQAYSKGDGQFTTPPWMKVMIRDIYDPYSYVSTGKSGGINVIDLANYYSCSFIETQDIGKRKEDNNFEVLGRIDNSESRGCNLMLE